MEARVAVDEELQRAGKGVRAAWKVHVATPAHPASTQAPCSFANSLMPQPAPTHQEVLAERRLPLLPRQQLVAGGLHGGTQPPQECQLACGAWRASGQLGQGCTASRGARGRQRAAGAALSTASGTSSRWQHRRRRQARGVVGMQRAPPLGG